MKTIKQLEIDPLVAVDMIFAIEKEIKQGLVTDTNIKDLKQIKRFLLSKSEIKLQGE